MSRSLSLADRLTISRIILVPFFVGAVFCYNAGHDIMGNVAIGIFITAALTDILDGIIARAQNNVGGIGVMLDPIADKLLLLSAFISLYLIGERLPVISLPLWVVLLVVIKDVILVLGIIVLQKRRKDIPLGASAWGKASTFFQILVILGVLLQQLYIFVYYYVVLFFVCISGIDYLIWAVRTLHNKKLS